MSDVKDTDNRVILIAKLIANFRHDMDTTVNSGHQKLLVYQVHSGWESILTMLKLPVLLRMTAVVPSCQKQQNRSQKVCKVSFDEQDTLTRAHYDLGYRGCLTLQSQRLILLHSACESIAPILLCEM